MTAQRSAWRFYPWAMAGAFVVVFAVNGGMVWAALSTFPGVATRDVFDHSNSYDKVLAVAAAESALGWRVQAGAEAGRPVLTLTDRAGQKLARVHVAGKAMRPVGPEEATMLTFHETAPGRYVADTALAGEGQWELRLALTHGTDTLHATPRVLVR